MISPKIPVAARRSIGRSADDGVRAVVARLTALLERYVAEGRSTPGPRQTNDAPVDLLKMKTNATSRQP